MFSRITRLKAAIDEFTANKHHFTDDTYRQIMMVLNEKLNAIQPPPAEPQLRVHDTDEIRLVTVFFVDVENSTHLTHVMGDDWKTEIGEIHRHVTHVVEEWGGEVGQYLGDGLLCFFGAHHSRDDDAARAVACAMAIQQKIADLAPEIHKRYNEPLTARIGMSTGRVVVGMIGTRDKQEVVAMGATTNLAARLQTLCPPGQVLIDLQTYYRVRDRFITQSQVPVRLKGFETLTHTYVVTGRRQRSPQLASDKIAGIKLPFVGRERELRHLMRLFEDALEEQQFHVITLYGETGLGKSRLLQEALQQASDRPFYPLTMVARYDMRMTSYNLLHDLLADLCDLTDNTPSSVAEARILQMVGDNWHGDDSALYASAIGKLAGFGFRDWDVTGIDALDAVARWLRSMAHDGALLLTVDNLQWADAASIQLLEYLAVALVDLAGVIVATARPEFRRSDTGYMRTCARYTEIVLGRLDDDSTRTLINSVLRYVDNPPDGLLNYITERAEGNPLFIEEFLHMLFDTHVFETQGENRWRTNMYLYNTMTTALPNGLMGVFQARLDDLPNLTRRVVQVASVIGISFWEEAVSYLSGFNTMSVLNELIKRGIVVQESQSDLDKQHEYRFRHTLYREVAYSMLTRFDKESFHQRAAEWLSDFVSDRPDYLGVLAEHFVMGQKREQALATYLAAAQDRVRRGLPVEALKMIESGLGSVREIPREIALPLVSQLWMWQGQALNMLRRYEEASAAGQTALMLMRELPPNHFSEQRELAARILAEAERHLQKEGE